MPTTSFALFELTFPKLGLFSYLTTMRKELADCRSCLDVGCGAGSPLRHLQLEDSVSVEGFPPFTHVVYRRWFPASAAGILCVKEIETPTRH